MEYDQEFEDYWKDKHIYNSFVKDIAYKAWQAAKSPKPEQKTIELQGGNFRITTVGVESKQAGLERKTDADAKKASELMRKRDRLAAFVYEHCGFEYEFKEHNFNYYIYIDCDGKHEKLVDSVEPDLCKQYMPEETASWLCEKLNSGEIVL